MNETNEKVVEETTEDVNTNVDADGKLTFTQEELDRLIQQTGDKRVAQALKTAEKKNAEKVKEAQKLAAMNESQKFQYELEQREAAILAKEKELALAENKNAASQILSEKGLSLDLVNFVVAEDAETMNTNIKLLDKAFKASVKSEVEKRLGTTAPKKDLPLDDAMTKEQFNKLSLNQLQELARTNPEIYKQFTK